MRHFLLVVLLMALAVQATKKRHPNFKSQRKVSDPRARGARVGGPQNNLMSNGQIGLPVPPESCVITWEEFTSHVVGRIWLIIYGINGNEEVFPPKSLKGKIQWTVTAEGRVNRAGILWLEDPGGCVNFNGDFERQHPTKAIFSPTQGSTGVLDSPNRQDIIVSDDARNFLLFYICYDTTFSMGGKCSVVESALLIPVDQSPMDMNSDGIPDGGLDLSNVDWSKIEKKSLKCIGERFVNNDALGWEWYWKGPECPFVK